MTARERLQTVQNRIELACESCGRDPAEVRLIAVSKMQSVDAMKELYDLGIRRFGESRLQEAQPKIEALPGDIEWHFIGQMQSNKAKKIASCFPVIHTLCSHVQLVEIAKQDSSVSAFIEINVANEPQKGGISAEKLDAFLPDVLQYPHVHFRGLMAVGPAVAPEQMRRYFQHLCQVNQKVGGEWLSMGMSGDYDVAIQEGSTHIRVGTALFGAR